MTGEWETLWQIWIWGSGGFVIFTILLMWARTVKKYWVGEMTRNQKKGDANGSN